MEIKGIDFKQGNEILQIWNTEIFPIAMYDYNFKLDLHLDLLQPFLIDRYKSSLNIFASFYDLSGTELVERAEEEATANKSENLVEHRTHNKGTNDIDTGINLNSNSNVSPPLRFESLPLHSRCAGRSLNENTYSIDSSLQSNDGSFADLALLNDMFEPLDFISLFDK